MRGIIFSEVASSSICTRLAMVIGSCNAEILSLRRIEHSTNRERDGMTALARESVHAFHMGCAYKQALIRMCDVLMREAATKKLSDSCADLRNDYQGLALGFGRVDRSM